MNILLDSHALLWALSSPQQLSEKALLAIREPGNGVFFSAASVWELELKAAKGKLRLPSGWVVAAVRTGFVEIPISSGVTTESTRLPWHHSDPFDRLLIAQAREQGLTLATRDSFAPLYQVPLLRV